MRVQHQPAYVLLNRPYSETSWIVEVFSRDFGRLALMAKGARRLKSKLKGTLLPFQPVLLSWIGKGEIPILTSAEIDQTDYQFIGDELRGDSLVCGFYCNELIINLLHRHDPHPELFDRYQKTVMSLNTSEISLLANSLRDFEQVMMRETGYEVSFEYEADGRTLINAQAYYYFQPSKGFIRATQAKPSQVMHSSDYDYDQRYRPSYQGQAIKGRVIHALKQNESDLSPQDLSQSKLLMRDILNQILGSKKIVSRELFFPRLRR